MVPASKAGVTRARGVYHPRVTQDATESFKAGGDIIQVTLWLRYFGESVRTQNKHGTLKVRTGCVRIMGNSQNLHLSKLYVFGGNLHSCYDET